MPLPESIAAVRAAIAGKRSELALHCEAVCAAAAEWARVGQWSLEDWVNEAQAIGMRREEVERVFYDVAAVGFIDFGGRRITNPRYYMAKRKAMQPSHGKTMQAESAPAWARKKAIEELLIPLKSKSYPTDAEVKQRVELQRQLKEINEQIIGGKS